MSFTPKAWKDAPDTSTPLSASALVDLETRLSAYTDSVGGGGGGGGSTYGRQKFDPMSYGCAGDGTTNDTTNLQAALTDAANANGILVLHKRHRTSAAVTASSPCAIHGESAAPRLGDWGYIPTGQIVTTGNHDGIVLTGRSAGDVGFDLRDFGVHSALGYASQSSGAGIKLTSNIATHVERCTVFNTFRGITVDGADTSWFLHLIGCEVGACKETGILVAPSAFLGDIWIDRCQVTNPYPSYNKFTNAAIALTNCTPFCYRTDAIGGTYGWKITGRVEYGQFVSCLGDSSYIGWLIGDGYQVFANTFMGCYAADNTQASSKGYRGVEIRGVSSCQWIGGNMSYYDSSVVAGAAGFYVDAAARLVDISHVQFNTYRGNPFKAAPIALEVGAQHVAFNQNWSHPGTGVAGVSLGGNHGNLHMEGNKGMGALVGSVATSQGGNRIANNQGWGYTVTEW